MSEMIVDVSTVEALERTILDLQGQLDSKSADVLELRTTLGRASVRVADIEAKIWRIEAEVRILGLDDGRPLAEKLATLRRLVLT